MWRRIKQLLGGGEPRLDDDDVDVDANGAVDPAPPPPDPIRDALAVVDGLVAEGDAAGALAHVRALLVGAAGDRRVLERASSVLAHIGETELAESFGRAAASRSAEPLIALAEALLSLDDPDIALALGEAARVRAPADLRAIGVVAGAHEARRDPEAVLALLGRFAPAWPDPGLARRFAQAVVSCGAWERWPEVADALASDPEGARIVAAADRARAFGAGDGDGDGELRQRLFVRYGAVLLDPAEDEAAEVTPSRLAGWLAGAAALLLERVSPDDRIAYVSPRSEVIAGWLADLLGTTAMPLSARLPQQPLVVAVADDDDLEAAYGVQQLYDGPSVIVQAVKDPARLGAPVADLIGFLGDPAALPFGVLEAERASDRLPPKLLVGELRAAAGDVDEAPLAALFAWSKAREGHLIVDTPTDPDHRLPFDGA